MQLQRRGAAPEPRSVIPSLIHRKRTAPRTAKGFAEGNDAYSAIALTIAIAAASSDNRRYSSVEAIDL
jgi:hypothetical protein